VGPGPPRNIPDLANVEGVPPSLIHKCKSIIILSEMVDVLRAARAASRRPKSYEDYLTAMAAAARYVSTLAEDIWDGSPKPTPTSQPRRYSRSAS
jgi:hypothetical protein